MSQLIRYFFIVVYVFCSVTAFCQKDGKLLNAAFKHADSLVDNLAEAKKVKTDAEQRGDRFGIICTTKSISDSENAPICDTILYQIGYYEQGIPCAHFVEYTVYYSIKTGKIMHIVKEENK